MTSIYANEKITPNVVFIITDKGLVRDVIVSNAISHISLAEREPTRYPYPEDNSKVLTNPHTCLILQSFTAWTTFQRYRFGLYLRGRLGFAALKAGMGCQLDEAYAEHFPKRANLVRQAWRNEHNREGSDTNIPPLESLLSTEPFDREGIDKG